MPNHNRADFLNEIKKRSNTNEYKERMKIHDAYDDSVFDGSDRGRVAIFIDGANLFYAALQLGIEIDYTKLLCRLTRGNRLLRAFFYTGVDPTNEKQQSFLLWMRRNGYRVIAKELIQFPDGSKKADLDVEIVVDMMALVDYYDTAVLVSGDGDLAYAVDAVSYRGARVEVVSLRSMTSDSLINVADLYTDLDTIKEDIQKASRANCTCRAPFGICLEEPEADPSESTKISLIKTVSVVQESNIELT